MGKTSAAALCAVAWFAGGVITHSSAQDRTPESTLFVSSSGCPKFDGTVFARLLVLDLQDDEETVDGRLRVRVVCESDNVRIRTEDERNNYAHERTLPRLRDDEPEVERILALATSELLRAAKWTRAQTPEAPTQTEVIIEPEPAAEPEMVAAPDPESAEGPPGDAIASAAPTPAAPTPEEPARFRVGLAPTATWYVPGGNGALYGAQVRFGYRLSGDWWLIAALDGAGRRTSGAFGDIGVLTLGADVGGAWRRWFGQRAGLELRLLVGGAFARLTGQSNMQFVGRAHTRGTFRATLEAGPRVRAGDWAFGVDGALGVSLPKVRERIPAGLTTTTGSLFSLGPVFARAALVAEWSF